MDEARDDIQWSVAGLEGQLPAFAPDRHAVRREACADAAHGHTLVAEHEVEATSRRGALSGTGRAGEHPRNAARDAPSRVQQAPVLVEQHSLHRDVDDRFERSSAAVRECHGPTSRRVNAKLDVGTLEPKVAPTLDCTERLSAKLDAQASGGVACAERTQRLELDGVPLDVTREPQPDACDPQGLVTNWTGSCQPVVRPSA